MMMKLIIALSLILGFSTAQAGSLEEEYLAAAVGFTAKEDHTGLPEHPQSGRCPLALHCEESSKCGTFKQAVDGKASEDQSQQR
jgi:hypothetical protein